VLRLLKHYSGCLRIWHSDSLVGGEDAVARQLREAASRQPSRFVSFLDECWGDIPTKFRNYILSGACTYLAHKYGDLQANNNWIPVDVPDGAILARRILDELEKHPTHWHRSREAACALEDCAHVVNDTHTATRIVVLANPYLNLCEECSVSGHLLSKAKSMARGSVTGALMTLSIRLKKNGLPWPMLLHQTLCGFASDANPAVRAVLLERLPNLQRIDSEFGWTLFGLAMQKDAAGLWGLAERCLYYAHHKQFELVKPWLDRLCCDGKDKDLETWGRITALSVLANQLEFSDVLATLQAINSEAAWRGAAAVWTQPSNMQKHREQCLQGLEAGLNVVAPHAIAVAREFHHLFQKIGQLIAIPNELLARCFSLLESEVKAARIDLHGIEAWLNATSLRNPLRALESTEIYLNFVRITQRYLHDHKNNLTQLLTRLFAQAEEQEESDNGAMLQRVVALQDALLALGVNGMEGWLKAAERP